MNATPVIKEILVNATAQRVWRALTDSEDMKAWYFDLPGFKAEVGYEFQFYGETKEGKKYLHLCQIKEVIPFQKLSYSWRYEGYSGDSLVTFELIPEGGQTLVRLTHSGLESFPSDNKDLRKENFAEGWESIIRESLRNHVEHH